MLPGMIGSDKNKTAPGNGGCGKTRKNQAKNVVGKRGFEPPTSTVNYLIYLFIYYC
jgi:hypothetical protein